MKLVSLVVLGVTLAAAIAGVTLLRSKEPEYTDVIYLLDARRDSSMPLEQSLPVAKQVAKTYNAKLLVRPAVSLSPSTEYQVMFEEFDRTRGATAGDPIFFALALPYGDTKKRLRSAIEERSSLKGQVRVQLLGRLIIVRGTEGLRESTGCRGLGDDIAYATWTFAGIGLIVRDETLQELRQCMQTLVR
jgi:hypothetical protein